MTHKHKIAFIGPVVWGSVWGHGPELAARLSENHELTYYDPLVPPGPVKSSFIDRESYAVPDSIILARRRSSVRPGIIYGLSMEIRNLRAVAVSGADAMVTYYPAGSILAMVWCRLTGRRSLFVYADRPDILAGRLAGAISRFCLRISAGLATAGCVATSKPLRKDIQRYNSNVRLIPNGVNLSKIARYKPPARETDSNSGITVAFAGAFGDWVDFGLVAETARACPRARFVLIGDGPQYEAVKQWAEQLPNIQLTGAVPHARVFELLAGVDICLVPFAVNPLTDRVCPVKLFEYWAMGKPVIATPAHELNRLAGNHQDALFIARNAAETASLLERFRDNPGELRDSYSAALKAVAGYDWAMLGPEIEAMLFPEAVPGREDQNG